ncbi:pseudouridine synthase [Pararhodospirillum oryzae]|uniref:Pseudouridine synthase n=1 Tax=Pararhodospirillum oryzae TaxID=478448 RepID=A0A512HBK2_9PROT|nr:pseudouridine synthase [Pararhodospirillum oryzae]GEO82815.1 pseudouridine synthase [Pararhodospirillum oryzae]
MTESRGPGRPSRSPRAAARPAAPETNPAGERIAKVIARAGVCSRREAESLIAEGRVVLNGRPVSTPATLVGASDTVQVDGKPLPARQPTRLWRYHKPAGIVTTNHDPQGRPTLFERLPADMPRVVKVGRLDLDSEGLLLLTNDGALARQLELPTQGWLRRYRVRVYGTPDPVRLAALEEGITIDGERFGSIRAVLERQQASNAWLAVSLREGRNREIRRVMEHLGLPVSRLIRVAYGPFQLGQLAPGAVEEVPGKILREQLGKAAPAAPRRPGRSGS